MYITYIVQRLNTKLCEIKMMLNKLQTSKARNINNIVVNTD